MRKKPKSRTCCACRKSFDKRMMLRVVKMPDGIVNYDKDSNINGRGAYVCKSEMCLLKAKASKGIDRSLKMTVPQSVYDVLKEAIVSAK